MAFIDLKLTLDDCLFSHVRAGAEAARMTLEEWLGRCLMTPLGKTYIVPSEVEAAQGRPVIHLDLGLLTLDDNPRMTGGCMCGGARYEAEIASDDAYLCHCRMCQRSSGNVSIAFVQIAHEKVRWLSEPDWYDSSPIARRPFCSACGTSLGFAYKDPGRGSMDLTVASFDDPSRFRPVMHAGEESLLEAWIDTSALPRQVTNPENEAAAKRDAP